MRTDHCDRDHRFHFHESRPAFRARCGAAFELEVLRPPPGGERAPSPFIGEGWVECHADHADLAADGPGWAGP